MIFVFLFKKGEYTKRVELYNRSVSLDRFFGTNVFLII
jgi:hypothetical protein